MIFIYEFEMFKLADFINLQVGSSDIKFVEHIGIKI